MSRKRLAVLGHPVAHSRSPAMQSAALAELGLGEEWSYEAIDVEADGFAGRVGAMPDEGFIGANVTVPHKLAALGLAGEASRAAREIGAANTLSFRDGAVIAENTDAAGLIGALGGVEPGTRALVLGGGGSARACVWGLVGAGAEVEVWNRTADRAEELAREIGGTATDSPQIESFAVIVNATSVGMGRASGREGPGLKALPVDADALSEQHVVVDLAYGSAETELARLARECGAGFVDGLEVLVHQGAASLRLWTGMEPPVETMRRAARTAPDAPF
ncbi:MAG TPA: shikimate dehydrogenase [Acidimicrobiia bacterium]|nr:shikimate dehydrogenase [Acidimicrobiia bacterium]